MRTNSAISAGRRAIAAAAAARAAADYVLRLYIVGSSPRSDRAVSNIRKICDAHLEGRYDLEVVDLSRHPEQARDEQIVAAPTLIKTSPLPVRRFIGEMSQTDRLLLGLDIRNAAGQEPSARAG